MEKRNSSLATPYTSIGAIDIDPIGQLQALAYQKFGISQLSDSQKTILGAVSQNNDCLAVLPTGSGKSLCYILPALLTRRTTIVISPLISLMHDQITQLARAGIHAVAFDYLQSKEEQVEVIRKIQNGQTSIVYVSPERFVTDSFLSLLDKMDVGLLAIDEAHCVAKWGYHFRQKYRKLGAFLLRFSGATKLALTATAISNTRGDIIQLLGLQNPMVVSQSPLRENLLISTTKVPSVAQQQKFILDLVKSQKGSGIIYAPTKKIVMQLSKWLRDQGVTTDYYHGDCTQAHRRVIYKKFFENQIKVIVSTTAFGMGINKSDIRFIIHAGPPKDFEAYLQEIGRAGRDGKIANCHVIYTTRDLALNKYMIDASFPPFENVLQVFREIVDQIQIRSEIPESALVAKISAKLRLSATKVKNALAVLMRENVIHQWSEQGENATQIFEIGQQENQQDVFWDEYGTRRSQALKNLSEFQNALLQDQLQERIRGFFEE